MQESEDYNEFCTAVVILHKGVGKARVALPEGAYLAKRVQASRFASSRT